MPMIDVYATQGTFGDPIDAGARLRLGGDADGRACRTLRLFRENTAAFIHELPGDAISNVAGESNYVRVQVLTSAAALDRDKQLGVVRELTSSPPRPRPDARHRTWSLTRRRGGWGIDGHANTNGDIVAAARKEIARG